MVKPRVGLFGILEKSEEGWERSAKQISLVAAQLEKAGMQVDVSKDIVGDDASAEKVGKHFAKSNPDLLLAFIITWSFDHLVLTVLRHVDKPVAILAIPGIRSGSLVGAQQLCYLLTEQAKPYRAFFGPPDADETYRPILSFAKAAALVQHLKQGKIAQIGRRCHGMSPAVFDELEVTRLFGPQVVTYSWMEIEESAREIPDSEVREVIDRVGAIDSNATASDDSLGYAARIYQFLKKMYNESGLVAISLGGYPQYAGRVCLVSSLLGDDGIVSGCCEGDLNSVIAMYLLQELSGEPAHFGEMLDVDEKEDTVVTSHCGCSSSRLASEPSLISIAPVRLFEQGACIKFPAKSGPATFVNLVGRAESYRICAVEGEARVTDMVFEGNPAIMAFNVPVRRVIEEVFRNGFGHHWIMGYDHVIQDLENFCKLTGLRGAFLKPQNE